MQTSTQTLNGSCCVMTKNGTKKKNKEREIDIFTPAIIVLSSTLPGLFETFITVRFNVDFEQMIAGRRCSQTNHTQVLLSNQIHEGKLFL